MKLDQLIIKAKEILYENLKEFGGHKIVVPHLNGYPIPYCWDTAFHVLALSHIDPLLAKENIEALLSLQKENGMIPNAPVEVYNQDLRSQPPIIIYAANYYSNITKDFEGLKNWYPKLKKFYEWWNNYGDPIDSINGLVSPFTGARSENSMMAYWAICSTGMDNHALYDFVNGETLKRNGFYYIPIEDLLLNNVLAADAEALFEIANKLGIENDAKKFQYEYYKKASLINKYMWNEKESFYYPIDWKGNIIKVKSIQAFTSLFSKILDYKNASRIISHLISPKEFWGKYGIPTIAFDDEKYMSPQPSWLYSLDPYYWRGPIWAPTTYFIFKGLLNYGYEEIAKELAIKWFNLINKTKVFAEYYYEDGKPGLTGLYNFGWTAAVTIILAIESNLIKPKNL